jgi:hypothetical protein
MPYLNRERTSMTMHRSPLARAASLAVAALAVAAPLAACSSDEDEADTSTEATQPATDDTTAADEEMSEDEEMTDDTMAEDEEAMEEASGDVGTTELLDFLLAEDPAIGALFDWNTGDGIIAVNYLGVQTVGLYAVEIDAATATQACELASEYVFELDETADIEVYTGGYSDGVLVVSRSGAEGTCTAV